MSIRTSIRRLTYYAEKKIQRYNFASQSVPRGGWPILLGISFPKSGTHLLDQILLGFSKVAPFSTRLHSFYAEYDGETGRKKTSPETIHWLDSLKPLDVTSAHLFARPEIVDRICTSAFVAYFIFRDPRDVVVSHVYYVTEIEPRHVHHDYYLSLPDFDSRLQASILGRPDAGVEFPDIANRFRPYLGWLDRPAVMKIQFEALVNNRMETLNMICDHFLARVPLKVSRDKIIDSLISSINPDRSPTFRSGKMGEWKQHFNKEHKRIFKDVTGDLIIRLGYESNQDW